MTEVNEKLRLATTGGFTLHLGQTAIARLVLLDHELRHMAYIRAPEGARWRNDMTGQRVLERVGLLVHRTRWQADRPLLDENGKLPPVRDRYRITPAGRLVIALLKEAGLYDEYARQLPPREQWMTDVDPGQVPWVETPRGQRWAATREAA